MKAVLIKLQNYRAIAFRWFLAFLLLSPATPLRSDEQTAVTSTRDATINQASPAANNGAATTVSTHTALTADQRSLVRFDLTTTGLNSNTAVKTSTLNLVSTTPLFISRSQEVHRIMALRIGQRAASPGTPVTALPPGRRQVAILIPRRQIRSLPARPQEQRSPSMC